MAAKLPYMTTPGVVTKILNKIIEARTPERFTIDFLETKLGFSGGSSRPIIPLLKRIGFLADDGTPTTLYRDFRSESTRGRAMAEALRVGYAEAFNRNEYAHDLDRKKFSELVNQISGAEKGSSSDNLIVSTFFNLKEFSDFESDDQSINTDPAPVFVREQKDDFQTNPSRRSLPADEASGPGINLAYTINLNLPETTNIEVFNAIFEALRKNLLGKS